MRAISIGLALILALAVITIGVQYLLNPRSATRSFGLPLPEEGAKIAWWLRLKGVRDVASGLAVLVCMTWAGSHVAGIVLLADATIPLGDMLVVLAGKGSTRSALGMHGATMVVMIVTGISLITGGR